MRRLASSLVLVAAALTGCREDVTGELTFGCALDRDCLPGWHCGAAKVCERGGADADATTSDGDASASEVTVDADGDATDVTDATTTDVTTTDTRDDAEVTTADATDARDSGDAADAADADVPGPSCAPLTHVVTRPFPLEQEVVAVRDLAFAPDGAALVATGLGLQGALAAGDALVPVSGLEAPFGILAVAHLGGGEWIATGGYAAPIVRFRLAAGEGGLEAIDVAPIELGAATMALDLLTPPTAFLVVTDLAGVAWLVEPTETTGVYHKQPIFGDLLEPGRIAFDPARGATWIAHPTRGRVTAFDAAGTRRQLGVPGTFAAPEVRSCDGLAEGAACLGPTGGQGTCTSGDAPFCLEAPNVIDPRLVACDGRGPFDECTVRAGGVDIVGYCTSNEGDAASYCWINIRRDAKDVCVTRQRGDGCMFLGEPRLGTPPPFDRQTDADQDGIPNGVEEEYGLDPDDFDYDDDYVWDGYEPFWSLDLDGDGDIGAKDVDSDGDGLVDGVDHFAPIPRYGNCLTAEELGRGDLAPEHLVCVDPTDFTVVDPFDRPMVTGLATHPCGGAVFTSMLLGTGAAGVYLEGADRAVVTLASSGAPSALERGAGGRFPTTTLYAYDQIAQALVTLLFCEGPCPEPVER
ncbi:MAG: hypothetical protein IT385_22280 [Deltaproteobacteria bacterium]|nr:hypothetical protein [Deltaproteobacteria bacterium]